MEHINRHIGLIGCGISPFDKFLNMLDKPETHSVIILDKVVEGVEIVYQNYLKDYDHRLLLIPQQPKVKSNQSYLKDLGFNTFKKLEAEYKLIKAKQSTLPTRMRNIVETVYLKCTKK